MGTLPVRKLNGTLQRLLPIFTFFCIFLKSASWYFETESLTRFYLMLPRILERERERERKRERDRETERDRQTERETERERVELSKILYVTKYINFYETRGFLTSSCVLYMCKQFIQFVSNFRFLQPHL